jgi:O-antigen/teichoic acid export membrane protein
MNYSGIYLLILTLIFILLLPGVSQAYIDPGSGYILLQVLIAVLIGGFFSFKRFWLQLFQRLHLYKPKGDEGEETNKE